MAVETKTRPVESDGSVMHVSQGAPTSKPAWVTGVPSSGSKYAARGMVASASPAAATVGLHVLMNGGNAFDAAIAAAAVENLTLPGSCGLGGDMFAVLYDAKSKRVYGINGSGIAPRAASRDYYVSRGHTTMPLTGIHAVSVPGAPHAYWTLHKRFGSRPLGQLLAPAIQYAEAGIPVSPRLARSIGGAARKLQPVAHTPELLPEGTAPQPGSRLRRPGYARSLRTLAEEGAAPFYQGPIADAIVRTSQELGGLFTREDFADHDTDVYEPIRATYRGVEVHATRPPSQGLIVLEWLNLLEGFDVAGSGFGTPETLHVLAETKKLAFADRLRYAGDPRFVDVPLDHLLSKSFAGRRRREVDSNRAATIVRGAVPESLYGDTSYFCVADGDGNAISFIHSLSAGYGSGVIAGDTGIVLNNRAGRGFTLEEGHPNVIEGGKKTMHTLNAYLLTKNGELYGVGGTPGGDQQPQWNVQTISCVVDHGMDPQTAIEVPRWYSYPGTDPEHVEKPSELRLESRFPEETFAGLRERGHQVVELGPWGAPAAVQVILRQPNGLLVGGSDPRIGGVALGF